MSKFTKEQLIKFIKNFSSLIAENKDLLTQYDLKIGDGDHGTNMNRGILAIDENISSYEDKTLEEILKDVGLTLVKTVGGASGPLYGTAFINAGKAVEDKEELSEEDLSKVLEAMIQGIKLRGKAEAGEKTMLDALIPALEAYNEAITENLSLKSALRKAEKAAFEGVEYTKTIKATKGRASYLGDRSIGYQDPGATSAAFLIAALNEAVDFEINSEDKDSDIVGIVLVSHSEKIADGVKELALEMAPNAKIISAGGLGDGSIGTDLQKVTDAIEDAMSEEGVLVIIDLGSAFMTAEMAIDTLNLGDKVEIVDAPFVEGALFAAVESTLGSNREKIKQVLNKAKLESKL